MANGIDKKALFKLKSEPYLKPISDLGVGFYNLDENTVILRFQLSNAKGPLLIHDNNLTAYAYFESSNGSASDVIELEIEDSLNGIVTITLDKEFLQASTSTKVKGQVYIGVNNVDGNPEYNEVAVFREFTFQVADALINKISSFTKIEYIRMFDQLKMRIEQKVRDIEEAIANGADYVAEMRSVLQQGIETLNAIVTDGKSDIQAYIAQAKTDLTKVKDNATEDINTTANNAKSSVQDTADSAVNSINTKTTEATEHVDSKVDEFNQTVEANGFLTPEKLTEDLTALEWQKYKLTENDGYRISEGELDLLELDTGLYETWRAKNDPLDGDIGFYHVDVVKGNSGRKRIVATQTYSNRTFVNSIHTNGDVKGWKEITNNQTDTGWIPFNTINGVKKDTKFISSGGFKCAYRKTIVNGIETCSIRINVENFNDDTQIAQLPDNFSKNLQPFYLRSSTNKAPVSGYITPNGVVKLNIPDSERANWTSSDYAFGSAKWIN